MAKVLQNFLIGVGLETENYDKGAKNVENSLSRMRSLTGITGAALAGAFSLVGASAVNAGQRVDDLSLRLEKIKASPDWVNSYGNALRMLGGNTDEALAAVNSAENALAQYRTKGDFGSFQEAAFAGVKDELFSLANAKDGEDFLRQLADIVPKMDKDQQRLIQDAWGLSDAVMRSLRGGVGELDAAVSKASTLAGGFTEAVEASREFNKTLTEVNLRFEGIGNTLAAKVLPSFTSILDSFGGFIDRNKDAIGNVMDVVADNTVGAALMTGGVGAAITGAGLKAVGMSALGSTLTKLGPYGMIAGAGAMAWDAKPEDIEKLTGYKPSSYIFDNTPLDAAQDAWKYISEKWSGKTKVGQSVEHQPIPQSPLIMSGDEVYQINPYYLNNSARRSQEGYSPVPQSPIMLPNQPEQKGVKLIVLPNPYPMESDKQGKPEQQPYSPPAPVYEGFQIDNKEAASITNPDVALIKEWIKNSETPQSTQKVSVNNNLEVRMELDGRAFDSRVTEVIERRERDAMDDVLTMVER